ncbi:MAG: hypothetical protein AAF409_09360 [Pseudomonadota bacterium]
MKKMPLPANTPSAPSHGGAVMRAVSGHGTVHFYRVPAVEATDDELHRATGGGHRQSTAASKDIVMKGSKIHQN